MISLFDADDAFADDSAMGYQRYTTDFKLACLKRYFTPPMRPVRDLAAELTIVPLEKRRKQNRLGFSANRNRPPVTLKNAETVYGTLAMTVRKASYDGALKEDEFL